MSRICELTGTRPQSGNKVSHSNIKTRTRRVPNLMSKRYYIPELKKSVPIRLTTRAIRTIDHQGGITKALLKAKEANLSDKLLKLRRQLKKLS